MRRSSKDEPVQHLSKHGCLVRKGNLNYLFARNGLMLTCNVHGGVQGCAELLMGFFIVSFCLFFGPRGKEILMAPY